jgi:hypothetical protein
MGLALALRLPVHPGLAIATAVALPGAAWLLALRLPWAKGLALFGGAFVVVLTGFLSLQPSNDRDWQPDVALIPTAALRGETLVVRHVRNCDYRTEGDYRPVFEDRTYPLDQLQALDLFVISWGPRHIAHTILSFDFGQGRHLAFSIETRKRRGQSYSALRGFFREYELCAIAGDERDLIRLRSNYRDGESVRLYRLNTPPTLGRAVLLDYVDRINGLARWPEWYNALTDNCTTALIGPVRRHSRRLPWSWKLVASGHLDELLYDRGLVSRVLPLAELRERSLINPRAKAADTDPAFSERIREGLPPR